MTEAEREWIIAAKTGDVEAFNQLVRMYEGRVYGLAYRMLGDGDSAADIAQDTFISAYKALHRFRDGSFAGWILRIATNACYDALRARKRQRTTSIDRVIDDPDAPPRELRDSGDGPIEQVLTRELSSEIQRGLLTLPDDQRVVLVMCDIQGFSYADIADATDTNIGTVKSRLSRGRAKLRDYLKAGELLPSRYR